MRPCHSDLNADNKTLSILILRNSTTLSEVLKEVAQYNVERERFFQTEQAQLRMAVISRDNSPERNRNQEILKQLTDRVMNIPAPAKMSNDEAKDLSPTDWNALHQNRILTDQLNTMEVNPRKTLMEPCRRTILLIPNANSSYYLRVNL